jgi:diadenosine tetraphosphatase ApaH/serine/threonine PP2A family protein phosphatase
MRLAVLSDIHANREALAAVESSLSELQIDELHFLGDAVGYNPDPEYCIRRISSLARVMVRGNHDKAVAEPKGLEWFNSVARAAILWTRDALSQEGLALVQAIPRGPIEVEGGVLLCHGSPMDEDLYITRERDVEGSFRYIQERHPEVKVCFFGHTHVPVLIEKGSEVVVPPARFQLKAEGLYLINPGSVGQPRDRDPRASFGVLDTESMTYSHYRVPYAIEATQAKIRAAGLPEILAKRLEVGW